MTDNIIDKVAAVESRLITSATAANRNRQEITLLAVSKTRSSREIEAVASQGITNFGENYLQEALEKINLLRAMPIIWHFIGPIQSNKTRQIAENFAWVHSVDRFKIAQRLSDQRPHGMPPLNICLQVNVDKESSKAGFNCLEVEDAVFQINELPRLCLRGLMVIPRARKGLEQQRAPFEKLRCLQAEINQHLIQTKKLDTLSMGMSADLEAAIMEKATIVRVGTDMFGPRPPLNDRG